MGISQLGYLVVGATDIDRWRAFGTQIAGLAAVDGANGELLLKADGRAFRMLIVPNERDRLISSGWEVSNSADFEALRDRLIASGVEVVDADPAVLSQRHVTGMFTCADPSGNVIEVYWGPISDFTRFVSPIGVTAFVMGSMGMGHVVLPALKFEETQHFWREHLGFGLSDILHIPTPDGAKARIHFMHCNPRQHSLALAEMPQPAGCVHMMLEVPDLDEVGLALDRVAEAGIPLAATLGRHVNDNMTSFYVWTPGGFALEYGCGGMVKDWEVEGTVFETTRGSHWGHQWLTPPAL